LGVDKCALGGLFAVTGPIQRLGLFFLVATTVAGCAARSVSPRATPIAENQLGVALTNSCPPPNPTGTPAPCGDLGAFDKFFLDSYQVSQDLTKARHVPVVIVSGSSLVLMLNGSAPVPVRVIPDIYHALKAIAHFPFAVYLVASREVGQSLSPESRAVLDAFLAREPAARSDLGRFPLTPEQTARQHQILDNAIGFVRKGLSAGAFSREQLNAFARSVGPMMLENTRDAGCAQVLSTHRQMRVWREAHPSVEWQSLVVVNRGSHQARYRNAATQYFAWLLGDTAPSWNYPGESLNVIYAEDIFTAPGEKPSGTDRSMEVFSTIVLDAAASSAFFGDAWRLSEDVLSDGASLCIAALPHQERLVK
jgi:hypothetical protein